MRFKGLITHCGEQGYPGGAMGSGRSDPWSGKTGPPTAGRDRTRPSHPAPRQAWSTFGPHAIGAERFATVSNGTSFAQVAGAILQ